MNSSTTTTTTTTSASSAQYDVIIIGGGAAGLAAGLALGRARRTVLIVDAGEPRNAPAEHMHSFLSRDGMPPLDFLAIGRAEVTGYGVEIVQDRVSRADRSSDGSFSVVTDSGRTVTARRLLLTTGLVDELPDVPGVRKGWGNYVIHCPYCHGYEVRDRRIGILATNPATAVHAAQLWRQWTPDVTLFLHAIAELPAEAMAQLDARGIRVVPGEVASLETEAGTLTGVRLESGQVIARDALVVPSTVRAAVGFVAQLGLETTEQRFGEHVMGTIIAVDMMGQTTVPGVFAAGNLVNAAEQVIGSAASGNRTGAGINMDLITEEVRLAVASASRPMEVALS